MSGFGLRPPEFRRPGGFIATPSMGDVHRQRAATADLAERVAELERKLERLTDRFESMLATNELWDGS